MYLFLLKNSSDSTFPASLAAPFPWCFSRPLIPAWYSYRLHCTRTHTGSSAQLIIARLHPNISSLRNGSSTHLSVARLRPSISSLPPSSPRCLRSRPLLCFPPSPHILASHKISSKVDLGWISSDYWLHHESLLQTPPLITLLPCTYFDNWEQRHPLSQRPLYVSNSGGRWLHSHCFPHFPCRRCHPCPARNPPHSLPPGLAQETGVKPFHHFSIDDDRTEDSNMNSITACTTSLYNTANTLMSASSSCRIFTNLPQTLCDHLASRNTDSQ